MLGAQASGAQVESFWLAVDIDRSRVNIGHPAAVSALFRVADTMTELRRFTAEIALQDIFSFDC